MIDSAAVIAFLQAHPDYVVSMVAGDPLGEPPTYNVAGVVLIRVGGNS